MSQTRHAERGFTLIELVVVVTMIGILGTMVVVNVIPILRDGERTKIKHDLKSIVETAKIVAVQSGSLPLDWEELRIHFEEEPADPWGNPYIYEVRDGRPQVTCLGRDQSPGGEGEDQDYTFPPPQDPVR